MAVDGVLRIRDWDGVEVRKNEGELGGVNTRLVIDSDLSQARSRLLSHWSGK
jgi:hypothetical protein